MNFILLKSIRILRNSFFILLLLAGLMIISFEIPFVRTFTENLIGKAVIEIVRTNAAANVEVYYGNVEFSIINSRFFISDIAITNPAAAQSAKTNQFSEANVVDLRLDIRGLWKIYFTRKLDIEGLYIYDSDIKLIIDPGSEQPSLTFETGNLYNHISRILDELDIRKFELHNGRIEFRFPTGDGHRNITLNDISLKVNNFEISSKTQQDTTRIFYTDDIELKIYNQNLQFADSLHNGYFDSLHVSTKTNTFLIYGFDVTPDPANPASERSNLYNISSRRLDIKGINFLKAYHEKILEVDEIILQEPDINTDNRKSGRVGDESDLIVEISKIFNRILIGNIKINNGKLIINTYPDGESRKFTLNNIDLDIEDVEINESNLTPGISTDYFNNFNLIINNYELSLPGEKQLLSIDTLMLSSREQTLDMSGINLSPIQPDDGSQPSGDLDLRHVKMTGFDPKSLIRERIFSVQELTANDLSWILTLKEDTLKAPNGDTPFIQKDLFQVVDKYLNKIHFQNIDLHNINIGLQKPEASSPFINLSNSHLNISMFELDSSSYRNEEQVLYSNQIILSVPQMNINSKGQTFRIENVTIDSETGVITTGRIEFDTLGSAEHLAATGTLDTLWIHGVDFNGILYEKKFSLDFIQFFRPEISVYNRSSDEPKTQNMQTIATYTFLNSLELEKLNLKNGILHFFNNGSQLGTINNILLELEEFELEPGDKPLELKNSNFTGLNLKFDKLKWSLPEIGHDLNINSFEFNKEDSTAVITALQIYPLEENSDTYNLTIPQINLTGLDIHTSIYQNNLNLTELIMDNPTFDLKQGVSKERSKVNINFEDASSYTFIWDTVKIDRITIDHGNFTLQAGAQNMSVGRFDLEAKKYLAENGEIMTGNFLFTEEIEAALDNMTLRDQETSSNFSISKLNLNTGNQFLRADSVTIVSGKDPLTQINIPLLTLEKMRFRDLLIDRKILLDEAHITNPGIKISQSVKLTPENQGYPDRFAQLEEYPLDTGAIRQLKINELNITDADIKVKNNEDSLELDNLSLNLTRFLLHPDSIPLQNQPFHADQYLIAVTDISRHLNEYYSVAARNITFHSGLSRLTANSLELNPVYGKYEFGDHIKEQNDWISLSAEKFSSEELDFERMVRKGDIIARHMLIEDLSIELFRDNNVPFPDDQARYLPQHYLKQTESEINIDTLLIKNSDIAYEELPSDGNESGKITFNDLTVQAVNITNQPDKIKLNPTMTVTSQGLIMKRGRIVTKFDFSLQDPENSYNYKASVGQMDLTHLNPILEPVAFVSVEQGFTSRMQLTARANDKYATGTMAFHYNDLKVELLNKETPDHKGLGKSISTFFANTFVVRKRNPRPFLRKGEIFFERDTTRSIFNYLSKTTLSGIISSIGAGNNRKEIRRYNRELRKSARKSKSKKDR